MAEYNTEEMRRAIWRWVTANGTVNPDQTAPSFVTSGTVDTELPAAAALSDAGANPTTPLVGAASMAYIPGTGWARLRTPNVFKPQSAVAIATEATVWTPAAGKKFRLMGGTITSSAAGDVIFRDNTAGTTIAVVPSLAGEPVTFDFGNGILSAAANNVLTADGPATSTLSGTLYGTED